MLLQGLRSGGRVSIASDRFSYRPGSVGTFMVRFPQRMDHIQLKRRETVPGLVLVHPKPSWNRPRFSQSQAPVALLTARRSSSIGVAATDTSDNPSQSPKLHEGVRPRSHVAVPYCAVEKVLHYSCGNRSLPDAPPRFKVTSMLWPGLTGFETTQGAV